MFGNIYCPPVFTHKTISLQGIIENNRNESQWYKMISDGVNTNLLFISRDTAQIFETKKIHRLTMYALQWLPVLQSLQLSLKKQTTWNPNILYYWLWSVLYWNLFLLWLVYVSISTFWNFKWIQEANQQPQWQKGITGSELHLSPASVLGLETSQRKSFCSFLTKLKSCPQTGN